MSLVLEQDYGELLRASKPLYMPQRTIRPPPGTLGAVTILPEVTIPPLNTDIRFSEVLPQYSISKQPGLAAMDVTTLPENFNWKEDGMEKSKWIADAGNQMLCGSCWAISAAGVIADNFVVSNLVQWKPHLSTTWCLSCYPQSKCQGGNSAILLKDISQGGIATENCVDYSWCTENPNCNGSATKHFDATSVNLSTLVPNCGCYDASVPHYLFKIDNPDSLAIGEGGITEAQYFSTVKKHIFKKGPVLGGYLVFQNFKRGSFTKINGGVYLENCSYDKAGPLSFDPKETSSDYYMGSHAVAIVGWGVQKNIIVDNNGTKKDVPYWYCRNSWTDKWGDNGYFKIAMYPYNKMAQFDKFVVIQSKGNRFRGGGICLFNVTKPPQKLSLKQLNKQFLTAKRLKSSEFYSTETHDDGSSSFTTSNSFGGIFTVTKVLGILAIVSVIGLLVYFLSKNKRKIRIKL